VVAAHVGAWGVRAAFSINGSEFNAKLISPDPTEFPQHGKYDGVEIHSGALADGVVGLSAGMAFWIRSADCPTVLLSGSNGEFAAVHAGKRSLLVEHWRPEFAALKERPSVLASVLERMATPRGRIRALVICGVGPKSYLHPVDHPVHGEGNRRLFGEVRARWGEECLRGESLSIPALITAQLSAGGVSRSHVFSDEIDTVVDEAWYSAIRGDTWRNHVLIIIPKR
jgi:copper oxidase (laccase) domain-containing protein